MAGCSAALHVLVPSIELARQLACEDLGLGRRTGAKVVAGFSGPHAVLQVSGDPGSTALACYLIQEAMMMSRCWP